MGYAVYTISIVWLTYTLYHDFLVVGAVLFVEYACYSATFLVGPLVDRVRNQRTIYLVSYPIQAVAVAAIGVGAREGILSVYLLLALVFLISILWDMSWAAINAAPGILLSADEQFAASGVTGLVSGVLTIVGYGLGGVLILLVGAEGGMFLYAALLGASALLALPLQIGPPVLAPTSFGESFGEGWKVVLGGAGRPFLQLATVDALEGFFTTATPVLITLLAAVNYRGSAFGYGVLFTADVIGGVAAGLALGRWNPRNRVGPLLGAALLSAGGAYVLSVVLPSMLILGALAWFAVGLTTAAYTATKYTYFRGAVAPEAIGRLFANMYLFPGISSSLGALVISAVAVHGAPTQLGISVGLGLIATGALALLLPGVRRLHF